MRVARTRQGTLIANHFHKIVSAEAKDETLRGNNKYLVTFVTFLESDYLDEKKWRSSNKLKDHFSRLKPNQILLSPYISSAKLLSNIYRVIM